jgi:sec-independent protein translocase protein TatC
VSGLYPEESQKLDVVGHLEELRRRILISLAFLAAFTCIFFFRGNELMAVVKYPLRSWGTRLVFIGPAEPFMAYVKIALLAGFFLSFPFILYQAWMFFAPALPVKSRRNMMIWIGLALALFITGVVFSYSLALPAALDFLIGFGKKIAVPNITIDQYVSFFTAFMLIGGFIFEIPLVIGLLTDIGVIQSALLKKKRHMALVIILVVAAVITPTQDVFNMMVFAIPMYLLYESGIFLAGIIEERKKDLAPKSVA